MGKQFWVNGPIPGQGTTMNRSEAAALDGKATGLLALLEQLGRSRYGAHFRIRLEDRALLFRLLAYMQGEREEAERLGLNLRKGILLTGPIGCGKTSLMTLMRHFCPAERRFPVISCRKVSFDFHREGYEVIQRYGQGAARGYVCLFDDLGTESTQKHYGNSCNVMGEILLSRYDQFVEGRLLTHLTTNLTSAELEQQYGPRVRSRMREMFNLLSFGGEAKDKRV